MVRSQISIRIDNGKREQLIRLASCCHKTYADLIRGKIDEILFSNINFRVKQRANKIIEELNQPFAYVKNAQGKKFAQKERKIRDEIIYIIKRGFNL